MKNKILFLDIDLDDFGEFLRESRNKNENVVSVKLYNNMPVFLRKIFI